MKILAKFNVLLESLFRTLVKLVSHVGQAVLIVQILSMIAALNVNMDFIFISLSAF